jgi:CheY-like chemotaxis protein
MAFCNVPATTVTVGRFAPTSSQRTPASVVLIVDDYVDTRDLRAAWLAHCGFRVLEAYTGEEALAELRSSCRISLPRTFDSQPAWSIRYELCERLKQDPRTRAIPVIAITGWARVTTSNAPTDPVAIPCSASRACRKLLSPLFCVC